MSNTISLTPGSAEQKYEDIKGRIDHLEELSGEDLKAEMDILKKALLENPDACQLIMDEDMGKMVEALRKITGQALATAAEKKSKGKGAAKEKKVALTAEDLQKGFDEL